jgi:hypothetical protein
MTLAPGQPLEKAHRILDGFVTRVYAILPEYVPL